MRKTILAALVAAASASAPSIALAQGEMTEGEVRKIDAAQGKITLRHGPIKKFDMDSMTMVFRVKDPGLLEGLKPGDKVRFEADRVEGRITIVRIEKRR